VQVFVLAAAALEEHAEGVERAGLGLMEQLILWAGFLGAWLLVAGPLHQARVELADEEFEREHFEPLMATLDPPPRLSIWWWLLPPLRLYLGHRRKEQWERKVWVALPDEDFEALNSFMSKARGWLLVGAGGLLIATKETWKLREHYEWPQAVFWILLVASALAAALNTVLSVRRTHHILDPT
jgi:hypothetical protein